MVGLGVDLWLGGNEGPLYIAKRRDLDMFKSTPHRCTEPSQISSNAFWENHSDRRHLDFDSRPE
jgi:hypothetical protein